jgi:glycerophosphoryl diester phosphodiesterase
MKPGILLIAALLAAFAAGCEEDTILAVPEFPNGGFLSQTRPLPASVLAGMEGVYAVTQGSEDFGSTVVVKRAGSGISIFAGRNIAHFILETGGIDTVVILEGYWRFAVNNSSGLARFVITREDGGRYLFGDTTAAARIVLSGFIGDGSESPSRAVTLEFTRPIRPEYLTGDFEILAHRAGGRTSDRIPASENTVEMIRLAEDFGATGIEIDVRLTRDGVPILYHDNSINPRLTRKTPLVGGVEEYTFQQVRTAIRLINGERIPTLREALETVLNETTLRFVWLDTKTEGRDVVARMVPLQEEILSRASAMGRDLDILVGIPTEDVYDEVLRYPQYQDVRTLCELDPDQALTVQAEVWAPRWTRGTLDADVAAMAAAGLRSFVWTLDDPRYIEEFIARGTYDGILTNYPTAVAYAYYVR